MTEKPCDIVLEGGGVKGIGLIGAVEELYRAGHRRCRVAGTSAGAIVGALLAADMPIDKLLDLMRGLDYTKFRDESFLDKLGVPGKTISLVFEKGLYEGKYLHDFLATELEKLGVRTFADLKLDEPWAKKLPPEQRYRLVVIASDVSSGRIVRFPWDYKNYGLDPDTQSVADAVRASMSIPFFYEPVNLKGNYLVDGGLLSNFAIDIFDVTNDWPTFGIKLSAKADALTRMNPVTNPFNYSMAILETVTNAHDQMHIDDPCTQKRTIFVDTFDLKATNFDITAEQQARLYENGRKSGREFLDAWNYADYRATCEKH